MIDRAGMSDIETFYKDDRFTTVLWNNVVITDTSGELDPQRMQIIGAAFKACAQRHPNGIVTVSVLQASAPVVGAEARAICIAFLKELEPRTLQTAMILESKAVGGMMLRAAARGINVFLRTMKISIYEDFEQAAVAVAPLVVPPGTPPMIARELSGVLAAMRKRPLDSMRDLPRRP